MECHRPWPICCGWIESLAKCPTRAIPLIRIIVHLVAAPDSPSKHNTNPTSFIVSHGAAATMWRHQTLEHGGAFPLGTVPFKSVAIVGKPLCSRELSSKEHQDMP